jgi:hypothetical protein
MDLGSRNKPPIVLDSSNAGRLPHLSSLQQLQLSGVVWGNAPGVLGALSQLTSLKLSYSW